MIGVRLGPYEITAKLGEGGMGQVWRAKDFQLGRDVALKVLPEGFTQDPERLQRFEREAKLLAQLNHPNIAQIYGFEASGETRALVMELVEGPTLAERLELGPFPFNESLSVSVQIARALEEAHGKGIVHRDLKPQNIKASPEGKLKVLDFGLAKAMDMAAGSSSASAFANSPTVTFGGTREGVILGTAAYMAPEQARGGAVDKRADIWAFGVVLYEMLTGERLFAEGSVVDTLSAVMRKEIDLGRLPVSTPTRLRELLRRCLERQPQNRLHDIADARIVLAELIQEGPSAWTAVVAGVSPGSRPPSRRWAVAALAGVVAGALVAWLGFARFGAGRPNTAGAGRDSEVRFRLPPPPGTVFPSNVENDYLGVSPDGSTLAFVAYEPGSPNRIFLRRIDGLEPRALAGTEGARSLTWSPDGRSIAFFAGDKLKRLELTGGAAVPICDAPPGTGLSASWGSAGEILFATIQGEAIFRVSAAGGVAEKIVVPDEAKKEFRVSWPLFLPDGRAFLYLLRTLDLHSELMLAEPNEPARAVGPMDSKVALVAPDLLVFAREGALFGQRFDRAAGRLVGVPVSIVPEIRYFYSSAWAGFAASPRGTLLLLTESSTSRIAWFDRSGHEHESIGPSSNHYNLNLSPDGLTLLADRIMPGLGTHDVWQIDLARGVETRLTSAPDADFSPFLLPDGRGLVYSRVDGRAPIIVRRDLATGKEVPLLPNANFQFATDVTRDGRLLAYLERSDKGKFQAWTLHLDGEPKAQQLFPIDTGQADVRFSPDGAWLAYVADDSGDFEAYVSPLASPGRKTRLSQGGARQLRWSRDGREIFYIAPDGQVMSVAVQTAPALVVGATTTLFTLSKEAIWLDFDVSRDRQRFVAIVPERSIGAQPATAILDWRPPAVR